jgi:hypothetical protein
MINLPLDLSVTYTWRGTWLNLLLTYFCYHDQLTPVTLAIHRQEIRSSKSLSINCLVSSETFLLVGLITNG